MQLLADTVSRPGAILRSECYRETNIALTYNVTSISYSSKVESKHMQDIEIYLFPSLDSNATPDFRGVLTFNNRKGERLDPNKL